MHDTHDEYLTVSQVATHFGVDESTVRRWIYSGRLEAKRTKPLRRDYRIARSAVEKFQRETLDKTN